MLAGIYAEKHHSSKKYQTKSWINFTLKQTQNEAKILMILYIYLWGEGTILFILDDAQFHRYFRLNGVQPAMGHPSAGEETERL